MRSGGGSRRGGVDIGDLEQVRAAGGAFDLVIHAASTRGGDVAAYRRVYLEGARHLRECFAKATFIFVSSTSVYAQRDGAWVTEESEAQPEHETGKVLREAEQFVMEEGGIIARLAGLYGPGRSALLRRVLEGEAVVDLGRDRFVNQIHRDDAAHALFSLANAPDGKRGQVFNVADDRPLLLSECYQWLSHELMRPLSGAEAPALPRKRGNSNKRINNSKLRESGWRPEYPSFVDGMVKSVLPEMANAARTEPGKASRDTSV